MIPGNYHNRSGLIISGENWVYISGIFTRLFRGGNSFFLKKKKSRVKVPLAKPSDSDFAAPGLAPSPAVTEMGWLESALSWDTRTKLTSSKWTASMPLTNPNSFSGRGNPLCPPPGIQCCKTKPQMRREAEEAGRCGEGRQFLF